MTKEDKIFQILQNKKKTHIALLQETDSTTNIVKKWEKEWEGTSYWHAGRKPKSLGVAILFKKGPQIEPLHITKNKEGRILSLSFIYEKQIFQLTYMHQHQHQHPPLPLSQITFYENLSKHLDKNNNQNLILAGDFNIWWKIYT